MMTEMLHGRGLAAMIVRAVVRMPRRAHLVLANAERRGRRSVVVTDMLAGIHAAIRMRRTARKRLHAEVAGFGRAGHYLVLTDAITGCHVCNLHRSGANARCVIVAQNYGVRYSVCALNTFP